LRNILVSGASGVVGYGILRSLRSQRRDLFTIGTSIYSDSAAPGFCDRFELAPRTGEDGYLDWLTGLIQARSIELIIPGLEIDMYFWVKQMPRIEEAGARCVLNSPELIALCEDKWVFFQSFGKAANSFAIPTSLSQDYEVLHREFGLPFLLKPRSGYGSKGIVKVVGEEVFTRHRPAMGTVLMAQPIVGTDDEEYTTAVFGDGNGGYSAAMTLRRLLGREGFTQSAEVVPGGEFAPILETLCARFRPVGPTNFQFRKTASGIKLLEINPRISSATSIRTAFGYNESSMAVDFFLDQRLPTQPSIRRGKAVRYTEDCIFYDDSVHL
jgi:carbamoyl-phosphate synthase large subunit